MSITFAVLGDGAWGTAVAVLLAARPEHRVRLWGRSTEQIALIQAARENARFLPGIHIPESVEVTADADTATAGADLWVSAIPTVYLRATLEQLPKAHGVPVLSLSKGIEVGTLCRPSRILTEGLEAEQVAVLSGPSHAEEVGRGQPTSVVVASSDAELAARIQGWFTTPRFRVYTNADVVGVELAGALKNVIGIAAGIGDGLGFGDNAKSALLTRAIVEMARFGAAHGADPATFSGLAGLGDLITTCISPHGRNRRVGERLGRGEKLADILATMSAVAEGVYTARGVAETANRLGLEMPICQAVDRVLYEGLDPRAAVEALMRREPKAEG